MYTCDICGKEYRSKKQLISHFKKCDKKTPGSVSDISTRLSKLSQTSSSRTIESKPDTEKLDINNSLNESNNDEKYTHVNENLQDERSYIKDPLIDDDMRIYVDDTEKLSHENEIERLNELNNELIADIKTNDILKDKQLKDIKNLQIVNDGLSDRIKSHRETHNNQIKEIQNIKNMNNKLITSIKRYELVKINQDKNINDLSVKLKELQNSLNEKDDLVAKQKEDIKELKRKKEELVHNFSNEIKKLRDTNSSLDNSLKSNTVDQLAVKKLMETKNSEIKKLLKEKQDIIEKQHEQEKNFVKSNNKIKDTFTRKINEMTEVNKKKIIDLSDSNIKQLNEFSILKKELTESHAKQIEEMNKSSNILVDTVKKQLGYKDQLDKLKMDNKKISDALHRSAEDKKKFDMLQKEMFDKLSTTEKTNMALASKLSIIGEQRSVDIENSNTVIKSMEELKTKYDTLLKVHNTLVDSKNVMIGENKRLSTSESEVKNKFDMLKINYDIQLQKMTDMQRKIKDMQKLQEELFEKTQLVEKITGELQLVKDQHKKEYNRISNMEKESSKLSDTVRKLHDELNISNKYSDGQKSTVDFLMRENICFVKQIQDLKEKEEQFNKVSESVDKLKHDLNISNKDLYEHKNTVELLMKEKNDLVNKINELKENAGLVIQEKQFALQEKEIENVELRHKLRTMQR